jgi:hypothetical protein
MKILTLGVSLTSAGLGAVTACGNSGTSDGSGGSGGGFTRSCYYGPTGTSTSALEAVCTALGCTFQPG